MAQIPTEQHRSEPLLLDRLTSSELDVARAIAHGDSNKQAAAALYVSVKTVEFHLTHVYRKLGVSTRSQLACRFARALVWDSPAF